jgi:hypothetical protein
MAYPLVYDHQIYRTFQASTVRDMIMMRATGRVASQKRNFTVSAFEFCSAKITARINSIRLNISFIRMGLIAKNE